MTENEKKEIRVEIANLQSLIDNAQSDNPLLADWKQKIANLKALLR